MRALLSLSPLILALVFIGFTLGAVTQRFGLPPASMLKEPFEGLFALYVQVKGLYLDREAWVPAPTDERGVTIHDQAAVAPGYILYTSADLHGARLIDQNGTLLHEWNVPLGDLWTEDAEIPKPKDYTRAFAWKAQLTPQGDLLLLYTLVGHTPYGAGMARVELDGTVKWSLLQHLHHDFNQLDDGRIVTLKQAWNTNPPASLMRAGSRVMEDFVLYLSPDGQIEKSISLIDAVQGTGFEWLYDGDSPRITWDISHANSVRPLTAAQASHLKGVSAGDLMLSLRELQAAVVLNPQSGKIVWAHRGQFFGQHDAEITPHGTLLVFDNLGRRVRKQGARVIEIDPASGQVVANRLDESQMQLKSAVISGQQQLDDGNMLIIESMQGRLLEVDPHGKIVWSYVNPVRAESRVDEMPVIPYAEKIKLDQLPATVAEMINQKINP